MTRQSRWIAHIGRTNVLSSVFVLCKCMYLYIVYIQIALFGLQRLWFSRVVSNLVISSLFFWSLVHVFLLSHCYLRFFNLWARMRERYSLFFCMSCLVLSTSSFFSLSLSLYFIIIIFKYTHRAHSKYKTHQDDGAVDSSAKHQIHFDRMGISRCGAQIQKINILGW